MSLLETHPQSFVHLHLHTQYSLLDGAIKLKDLFAKAKEYGMPAVAQTDHGNMHGSIDFYLQSKDAGVKGIIGCEIYLTPGSRFDKTEARRSDSVSSGDAEEGRYSIHHLVLLCKNNVGYQNLCRIVSKANLEGFYYKPRADYEVLKEFSEGLIATTACLKGEVGHYLLMNQEEKARRAISKLKEIFKDDLYLEIQENGLPEQKIVNERVIPLAKELGIPLVATNDCHYLNREDAAAHEVLLCVQTGKTFEDEHRMKLSSDHFYLKSPQEMREAFKDVPEACDNTLKIAEMCNVSLKWKDEKGRQIYHLPDFKIDTGETVADYFARMSREGMEERFRGPHFSKLIKRPNWESELKPKYLARLEEEIAMIIQTGFPGYFLIVSDFIKWAKQNDIPVGPGRGSGAGSLVAYCLSITNIDPIPFNLLFERFINPERISMPDFDVDFCQDRRGEVIDYVKRKYGEERVAQIATFGKLTPKAVIKDVARVFGLPFAESNMLTSLVPEEEKMTVQKSLDLEPKLKEMYEGDPKIRQIFNTSMRLEGLYRQAGIHAAGVIITSRPVVEYAPLMRDKEGGPVVQFDKDFSEKIGLVKFDFLGLKTLTVIKKAVNFIRRDKDPKFDIEEIDLEDKNVFDFIGRGETVGVFQLESSGMIDLCKRIQPNSIDDITAINALYRPGPLESGMVDDFIEIKHGRKEMAFPFAELEPVLKDTYGVIVYQEQVMNIARTIAGYTLGQADMLRRAMGKKKEEEMVKNRGIFLEGAGKKGYDLEKAGALYDLMANFAAYGFNKSHAVAYAVIAYQTAFLKNYFTAPFYAALLSTEMNDKDKLNTYISDAKKYNVEVLPPDVNESLWLFNVVGKDIRYALGPVKNVGLGAVEEIRRVREESGPFTGFVDFCERIDLRLVNKRAIESMILVGAFDRIEKGMNRRTMLENMELVVAYANKKAEEREMGQVSLFEAFDQEPAKKTENLGITNVPDFDEKDRLDKEFELVGFYVSGHPLARFAELMKEMSSMPVAEVQNIQGSDERQLILTGVLCDKKVILTKKGDKMAFANLEDMSGKIECVIFPKTFAEYEKMMEGKDPVVIEGTIRLGETPRKMFPSKILELKNQADIRVSGVRVCLDTMKATRSNLERLKQVLVTFKGAVPLHLIFESQEGRARLPLGENYLVHPSPQLASRINEIFNANSVKFIVDGGQVVDPMDR